MSGKTKKPGTVICTVALAVFILFVGLIAASVNRLSSEVDDMTVGQAEGVPRSWSEYETSGSVLSQTETEIKGDMIVYTTVVTNRNQTGSMAITHIASYVGGGTKGFLPLNENSLEYSYYPDMPGSWNPLSVTNPGDNDTDFKLATDIYIGSAGSSNSKVYFRYSVTPSTSGEISGKVSFIAQDATEKKQVITSESLVAYELTAQEETIAVASEGQNLENDNTGESAFAAPLGVTSDEHAVESVPLSLIGAVSLSEGMITGSLVVLVICVGIFVASLIAYLATRKKEEQKSRLF